MKLIMNAAMKNLLEEQTEKTELNPDLIDLIISGFVFEGDYVFLKKMRDVRNFNPLNFYDNSAVETFINSFYINDLNQAIKFCNELEIVWKKEIYHNLFNLIIGNVPKVLK